MHRASSDFCRWKFFWSISILEIRSKQENAPCKGYTNHDTSTYQHHLQIICRLNCRDFVKRSHLISSWCLLSWNFSMRVRESVRQRRPANKLDCDQLLTSRSDVINDVILLIFTRRQRDVRTIPFFSFSPLFLFFQLITNENHRTRSNVCL